MTEVETEPNEADFSVSKIINMDDIHSRNDKTTPESKNHISFDF